MHVVVHLGPPSPFFVWVSVLFQTFIIIKIIVRYVDMQLHNLKIKKVS